ncbi:hypothetical protein EE612_052234 [Oryza sativa]|nr:hypothetical protein EE612_052234 [Oryza sativa]
MGFRCFCSKAQAQHILLLPLLVLASASSSAAKQQPHTACSNTSPATGQPPCSGHRGQVPAPPIMGLLGRRRAIRAPPPPQPHPITSPTSPFPGRPVPPPPPSPCL